MSYNTERYVHAGEHLCGNFTCVGTVLELAYILHTGIELAALFVGMVGYQLGIDQRRAEHNLRLKVKVLQFFFDFADEVLGFIEVLVHLPVSNDDFRFHNDISF